MKPGKKQNFFKAAISDGTAKHCLVGFSSSQIIKLQNYSDTKKPLLIDDCEIKKALWKTGIDDYEVFYQNIPAVEFSATEQPKSITLDKIKEMDIYQRVSVTVKVLQVGAENILGKNAKVTIGNATSTATVTL